MDPLLQRVTATITEHELLRSGERVLAGISGGADSIVLAHSLIALGYDVAGLHVNFRLRGRDADDDEAFVREWCGDRAVALTVRSFDTAAAARARGRSVQEAARDFRYEALAAAALELEIDSVAVGHHLDDQAETVLLQLFRGTGPEGLSGMPIRRRILPDAEITLVRPLLYLRRADIEAYARAQGLDWREDATNVKSVYRRGALRGRILPEIEASFGPAVSENIVRSADLVRELVEATLDASLRDAFRSVLIELDDAGAVDLTALEGLSEVFRQRVLIEAIRRWLPGLEATSLRAAELDALRLAQPGRRRSYAAGDVWRERGRLLFLPSEPSPGSPFLEAALELGGEASVPDGVVRACSLDEPPDRLDTGSPNDAFLDARDLAFPMRIRTWRNGDRFLPLGMNDSKKLSDFLTDAQVAPHRKRDVLVVESNGEIVWVVGHRISHAVRVRSDTRRTVRLSFHPFENTDREPR